MWSSPRGELSQSYVSFSRVVHGGTMIPRAGEQCHILGFPQNLSILLFLGVQIWKSSFSSTQMAKLDEAWSECFVGLVPAIVLSGQTCQSELQNSRYVCVFAAARNFRGTSRLRITPPLLHPCLLLDLPIRRSVTMSEHRRSIFLVQTLVL